MPDYWLGYEDARGEVQAASLRVEGCLPDWLEGTLLRNGPARYHLKEQSYRHWFDGLAMLHRFAFANGKVEYGCRFLRSPDYLKADRDGRIPYPGFASDPCRGLFRKFMSLFTLDATANGNVSVARLGERFLALTELPMPVEFDPETLETLGVYRFDDSLAGGLTTAHPHYDFERDQMVSYLMRYGPTTLYQVTAQRPGSAARHLLGSVATGEPSYMHSFGYTRREALLCACPFVVKPLQLLVRSRPFIENFRWRPEMGTIFHRIGRDGRITTAEAEPFFCFHHLNTHYQGQDMLADLVAYPEPSVHAFYLQSLVEGRPVPVGRLRRYRLRASGDTELVWEGEQPLELPTLHYRRHNGRPYRFCYGVGRRGDTDLYNQLVKQELEGDCKLWYQPGTYPGEPIFVAHPEARREDQGVVLSVVLDVVAESSFLLVLDAESFAELARASVCQPVPFGFHGQFIGPRP